MIRDGECFDATCTGRSQPSLVAVVGVRFKHFAVGIENAGNHGVAVILKGQGGLVGLCDLAQSILAIVRVC